MTLDDITISSNRVTDGGNGGFTIGNNTAAVLICRATITNNAVTKSSSGHVRSGAGAFFNNFSVTMTDSTISCHSSVFDIGAMGLNAKLLLYDGVTGLPGTVLPQTANTLKLDRVSGNIITGEANGGSGYSINCTGSLGCTPFKTARLPAMRWSMVAMAHSRSKASIRRCKPTRCAWWFATQPSRDYGN